MFNPNNMIKHLFLMEKLNQPAKGENQVSSEEAVHKCTACEEDEDASSFCTDCEEWLCEQCVQAHRRVRVTKDHIIEPKDKVQQQPSNTNSKGPLKQRFMNCSLHQHEPLKLYCETCDKLTCRDCQLLEHKEHSYQFVQEASDQSKNLLLSLVEKMKEKRKCIENAKMLNSQRQEEIVSREKVVSDEIKQTVEKLVEEFNKRAQAILADLSRVCSAKKALLNEKNNEVVDLASRLDHCLRFVQSIVENGTDLSILHTKSTIIKRIRSVLQSRCEVPNPNHVVDIRYNHDINMFIKNLNHLGLLFVDGVPYRSSMRSSQQPGPQPNVNGVQTSQPPVVRNYLQELQKLSPDQRSAVFQRMMQMQRRQAMQSSGPRPSPLQHQLQSQAPPNRVVSNTSVGSIPSTPYNNNSNINANNCLQNSVTNGPAQQSPIYSSTQNVASLPPWATNQVSSNQPPLISLLQLQNQRSGGHPQHPNNSPAGRPMPPLIPRPSNNSALPPSVLNAIHDMQQTSQNVNTTSSQPQAVHRDRNLRWHNYMPNMISPPRLSAGFIQPGLHTNQPYTAQHLIPFSGNGPYPADHRPGSSNSAPESSRYSPSVNSSRPASADSVRVKQEKDASPEGYGGYSSCSFADKDKENTTGNGVRPDQRQGSNCQSSNNSSSLINESMDNLEAALQSLSEDGLSFELGSRSGPNPHSAPVASKHMDSPDPSEDYCACCHNGGELLCCDYCPKVFHFQCHIPAVTTAPSGSWKCTLSLEDNEIRIDKAETKEALDGSNKRKSPVGLTDRELRACERILLELFSHEASTPFHEPVSKSVPNYYKIITNPMDFTNIKCKLSKQHFNRYATVKDFLLDIKLVFTNCALYNSEQSEVGRAGRTVYTFFEQLVERFLPYYAAFLKEDRGVPSPPSRLPPTPPYPNMPVPTMVDSEQARGAKRRKMDKQNVLHYF